MKAGGGRLSSAAAILLFIYKPEPVNEIEINK